LIPIITRSADALGLKLARLQPEAGGVVSVVIQGQPFNDVVRWLAALEENNGVQVDRASIDAGDLSGIVNAQIRLN
jgi:type II secretory pathway component PulM